MRIFIFLLSLIFCGGFVCLNVLGFNGTLSQTEFILISLMAEVLLCLVLGHFMFRTYANNKRAKKLTQELASAQHVLETQAAAAKAAADAARQAQHAATEKSKSDVTAPHPAAPAPSPADTQPLEIGDNTTLFKTPFKGE